VKLLIDFLYSGKRELFGIVHPQHALRETKSRSFIIKLDTMKILLITLFIATALYSAFAIKGTAVTLSTALTLASESYTDVQGMLVTAVTTETNERLIITIMLTVKFATASEQMKFQILRNGAPLATNQLAFIESKYAGEVQPVVLSLCDVPGPINSYTIKVQAAGTGIIGNNGNKIRQLSVIQLPASVAASTSSVTNTVAPPSVVSGLSATVSTGLASDKIFVCAMADGSDVSAQADYKLQFSRGSTAVGTLASFGLANSIVTPVSVLDSPGTVGSFTYNLVITRPTSYTQYGVLSGAGSTRKIYALVLAASLTSSASTTTPISVTSTSWISLGLTASVTTVNSEDKVFLIFNADLIFMSSTATTISLTVTRNGANIGDSVNGLLTINAGPLQYSRRSPMMLYMDSPGAVGTCTYVVQALNAAGQEIQFGRANLQTSFAAVLVSNGPEPTAKPTSAPTRTPTVKPSAPPTTAPSTKPTAAPTAPSASPTRSPTATQTATPTAVPTFSPTRSPTATPTINYDCANTACTMMASAFLVGQNYHYGKWFNWPRYFSYTFQILNPTLAEDALTRRNIMDLIDDDSGESFLSVYTTEELNLQYRYAGNVIAEYGPALVAGYVAFYTTVTIVVMEGRIILTSSADAGVLVEVEIESTVDTTDRTYYLHISNTLDPTSAGTIRTMSVSGKARLLFTPIRSAFLS
jgi:hypothetical protein